MGCPRCSLKLFCSIDIIDSTAFKNKHLLKSYSCQEWFLFFRDFYDSFRTTLQQSYDTLIEGSSIGKDSEFCYPYQWKNIGDEIVFFTDILRYEHLIVHIDAFKKTIEQFNKDSSKQLKVKGTSWLAGFPVVNAILDHKNDEKNVKNSIEKKLEIDFIGPSIDLGFRIAKFSTHRKFVISVDLAYVLLCTLLNTNTTNFHFYFDRNQDTKGINGNEYPIIWIDNFNSHDPIEDELYGIKRSPSSYALLHKFCKTFIYDNASRFMPPFIYGVESEDFKKPEKYDELYNSVCEKIYEGNKEDIDIPKNESDISSLSNNKIGTTFPELLKLIDRLKKKTSS